MAPSIDAATSKALQDAAAMLGKQHDDATEAARAAHKGFCDMRFRQPTGAWDTLDDVDTNKIKCLQDLYELVIGPALRQANVVGQLDTGGISLTGVAASHWSGGHGVHFHGHDQVWQVRSAPKGRIGKRIERDEVRLVSVLIRPAQRSSVALVSTFRLYLLPPLASVGNVASRRGSHTCAALNVPIRGLHIFSHQGRGCLQARAYLEGKNGYHVVLGSYATLQEQAPDGPRKGDWLTQRVVEGVQFPLVVAAHLDGLSIPDEPMHRQGIETFPSDKWLEIKTRLTGRFGALISTRHAGQNVDGTALASRLVFGAMGIAEHASLVGVLDMIATPFFEGAMPNELHEPCGLPLLLAMAVRIACFPHRYGLEPGTADDHWACREARHLLESVQPGVIARDGDASSSSASPGGGEQMFAVDIVINHAMSVLTDCMDKLERKAIQSVLDRMTTEDGRPIKERFHESLEMLRRAGVGVCIDVCGVAPRRGDGLSGIYTQYGLAHGCCDPIEQSRCAMAYDCGLGDLEPFSAPIRTSTRGARQMALVRVLTTVEYWLATGMYNNIVVQPTRARSAAGRTGADPDVDRVNLRCETDREGNVTNVTLHEPDAAAAAPAAPTTTTTTTTPSATPQCSNRKKQRGANKRVSRAMRAAAASASSAGAATTTTTGVATDEQAIDKAVATAQRRRQDSMRESIEAACSERLRGNSLAEAAMLLSDTLQMGVCFAASTFFDCQTFVVGPGSTNRCAHCHREVNVVENMAFAGKLGACANCHHPRCLHCVHDDIDVECRRFDRRERGGGEALSDDDADPLRDVCGRELGGCLVCGGSKAHAVSSPTP